MLFGSYAIFRLHFHKPTELSQQSHIAALHSLLQQTWAHQLSPLHIFAPLQWQRVGFICIEPTQWLHNTYLYSINKSHWKTCGRVVTQYLCFILSLSSTGKRKLAPTVCRFFFLLISCSRTFSPVSARLPLPCRCLSC